MKKIDYMARADEAIAQIKQGAFLTVKSGDALNTMTIGWGLIGRIWRRPMFMVAVRWNRHTYTLIEKAADFTVTFPTSDMADALQFCGTRSGRDGDKFAQLGLGTLPGQAVGTPVIDTPGIHYECRIVFRSAMDPANLDPDYDLEVYPDHNYHTLYFGEILSCYVTE